MAFTEMSLPVDIPWKRMAVSEDMIDQSPKDLNFPKNWNSSAAVFYHEPTDLPPEYCNRKITYLKVVCTLTNYNPWRYQLADQITAWKNVSGYASYYYKNLTRSIPCFGALLQVSVFPNPIDDVELHDYPYISGFQPRKREMYETVTESGEVLSQSANNVNVGKQMTGTVSDEDYDLDTGSSYSHGVSGSGVFGLASGSEEWSESSSGQFGTIARNNTQNQKVSAVDSSREKRESFSYSTSVNNIYSLLQSYHLGTNRVTFFMQPRPHIQDTKFTFINGPRRLEGIQEFFLIVNRPKTIPGFCVDVSLETAHIHMHRAYKPRLIPFSDLYVDGNLKKTARALGLNVNDYPYLWNLVGDWNGTSATFRLDAFLASTGEYDGPDLSRMASDFNFSLYSLYEVIKRLPDIGTENIALIFEEYDSFSDNFFVLGRRLQACALPETGEKNVDIEKSAPEHLSAKRTEPWLLYSQSLDVDFTGTELSGDHNFMGQVIETMFVESVDSPNRYKYGELTYYDTAYAVEELAQLDRLLIKTGVEDVLLSEIEKLQPYIEWGLGSHSSVTTVSELAEINTLEIAKDLSEGKGELSEIEATREHRKILVAALDSLDVQSFKDPKSFVNPVDERYKRRYPNEELEKLVKSAYFEKPTPKRRWWWPFRY